DGYQGMDIGNKTRKLFANEIKKAKTIVWNGPLGVYEFKKFQKGTKKIAKAVAKSDAVSVVGGGATLKFLEGAVLPGVEMLEDK
ncbi:MAG: phosphoglycerate kinase, partial [Clostridia bacterium]|nr:phosphoglycerate kinase [Clostridia bacterium]